MPKCEQFVYTAGKIGDNEGYQVIAKSAGVDEQIISEFSEYLYPLGVKVSEFNESRSLLILPRGKISYSIVKNIGIGYDGRRGTLYNHTFVMDITDFEKLDFDSRIFDKYFRKDDKLRGELKPIEIERVSIPPNFDLLEKLGPKLLSVFLFRLFRRNKIAFMETNELNLIQNLLAVLPPLMRLIPFSTLVVEPDRQYKFDFIQIPERAQAKLDKSFTSINPAVPRSLIIRKYTHEESIEKLVQIILDKDLRRLKEIHKDFDKIPELLGRVRRIKIDDIFNPVEFKILIEKNNFSTLKNRIKKLYSSRKFNQASPVVIFSITKQIRKMIKRELKKQSSSKKKNTIKINHSISMLKILLDHMNYLQDYSEKQISISLQNKISNEIMQIEDIMHEYATPETEQIPYVFNPMIVIGQVAQAIASTIANGIAMSLWWVWKR